MGNILWNIARFLAEQQELLEFDLGASGFQLLLGFFSVSLRQAFLNSLRSTFNHVLGFLQAQTGQFTNSLNNSDLVRTDFSENNVEFRLFFSRSSSTSSRSSNSHSSSGSRNTELFFHHLDEFGNFENSHGRKIYVEDFPAFIIVDDKGNDFFADFKH